MILARAISLLDLRKHSSPSPFDAVSDLQDAPAHFHNFLPLPQAIWVFSLIDYEPPTYHNGDYIYPWWAEAIGWSIASLSLICIPAFAVYVLVRADGVTFAEVRDVFVDIGRTN